jgi:hypothetical protein
VLRGQSGPHLTPTISPIYDTGNVNARPRGRIEITFTNILNRINVAAPTTDAMAPGTFVQDDERPGRGERGQTGLARSRFG